jgi:hypothetical protein
MKMFDRPVRRTAGVCVLALAVVLASRVGAQASEVEFAYVSETINTDEVLLVNEEGLTYRIMKDSGCLALSQYEGRLVLVYSPRGGITKDSEIVLLEGDQRCKIVDVLPMGKSETTPGKVVARGLSLTRTELRELCRIALTELGRPVIAENTDEDDALAATVRSFQEEVRIEPTGELGPVTMLAIAGQLRLAYWEEPTMLTIAMLISKHAGKKLQCDAEQRIESVGDDGRSVTLDNGERYRVRKEDAATVSRWVKGNIVVVCSRVLFNQASGDVVAVSPAD